MKAEEVKVQIRIRNREEVFCQLKELKEMLEAAKRTVKDLTASIESLELEVDED